MESFIYKYHPVYGSPPVNNENCKIKGVKVSEDGLKVRLVVDGLRRHYVHNITLEGVREKDHFYSLVHPTGFYTLHNIPEGDRLAVQELSTRNSAEEAATKAAATAAAAAKVKSTVAKTASSVKGATASTAKAVVAPSFAEVKPLLAKYTCLACHNATKKQVGPAFIDVAKRNYSNEQIVKLIYNPQPQNWSGYATEMPPMPHVPKADALKIAAWINSLVAEKSLSAK